MSQRLRLSKADVKVIFDCLINNVLPPHNLSFRVLVVPLSNAKISPPTYEYKHGIYVMIAAPVPSALTGLIATEQELATRKTCNWRSSGLKSHRSNLPDAPFLLRYCYPVGDDLYSENNGATVWTRRSDDGKEDLTCRILHVYPTQKRSSPTSTQSDRPKRQKVTEVAEEAAESADDDSENERPVSAEDTFFESLMTGPLVSTPVGVSFWDSLPVSELSNPEGIFNLNGSDPFSLLYRPAPVILYPPSPGKRFATYALSPRINRLMMAPHSIMTTFSMKLENLTRDILSSDLPTQTEMLQMLQDTVKKLKAEPSNVTESTNIKEESPTKSDNVKVIVESPVAENYTITP